MKRPTKYLRERMLLKNKPRRVLNLEERILALRLYDHTPIYQRVASVFKCSWEQIKNVISNRDSILQYYAQCQTVDPDDTPAMARHKKINFLGNLMYEYIKRAYYHSSDPITDVVIRERALEFRDILQIDRFYPNKAWIQDFKNVYNIDLEYLHNLIIAQAPHKSLICEDIVAYCTRIVAQAKANNKNGTSSISSVGITTKDYGAMTKIDGSRDDYDYDCDGSEAMPDMQEKNGGIDDEDDNIPCFSGDIGLRRSRRLCKEENEEHGTDDATLLTYNSDGDDYDNQYYYQNRQNINYSKYGYQEEYGQYNADNDDEMMMTTVKTEIIDDDEDDDGVADGGGGKDNDNNRYNDDVLNTESTAILPALPTTPITKYTEALNYLRPLQDFAIFKENFRVINLLAQLAELCDKEHDIATSPTSTS